MANSFDKNLPDFDDMDKMAKIASTAKAKLEDCKNLLDETIAKCIREAIHNKEYWTDGKPPTMSYCNSVIAVLGNNKKDEEAISNLKFMIAKYTQEFQEAKAILDNMKDRIHVWQSASANHRKTMI